jgi:hypothetical protein
MIGAILTGLYCYVTPVQVPDIDLNVLVDLYTGVYDSCNYIDNGGKEEGGDVFHHHQQNTVPSQGKRESTVARSDANKSGGFRGVEVIEGGLGYAGISEVRRSRPSTDYARDSISQGINVEDSKKVERNRLSKRGRKTKRADASIMLTHTRYAPGVVDRLTERAEGADGSYIGSGYVHWETSSGLGRLGGRGERVDNQAKKTLDNVFLMCIEHVQEQLSNNNKAAIKELEKRMLRLPSVSGCEVLMSSPLSELKVGGIVKALARTRSPSAKSLVILDLMESGIVPDLMVAPAKANRAARTKINIKLCDLLKSVKLYFAECWVDLAHAVTGCYGMSNDQFSGWVMWYAIAHKVDRALATRILHCCGDIPMLKELSTAVKALGLNSCKEGAMICELNTLIGRGALPGLADDDVETRVNYSRFLGEKAAVIDEGSLRRAIREVMSEELATAPKWMDKDDYWSRRWMYTKSGSHTRHIEDIMFGERLDLPEQPTRREFAESVKDNIVGTGEPSVWAGLSWKLENGKTRAIYGCDTRSYFTFDYLLRPIEAVWRNSSALLNPGLNLQSSLYPELAKQGPFFYMLDFDDYNSQHTLGAMKMVIEEATRGAPEDIREWAVNSWDNMNVRWISDKTGKLETKRMVGTLPSGHRATTFINTVLNAAYCRVVMGDAYKQLGAYHAGDDVIMWGPHGPLSEAISGVEKSTLRVNRSKQSIGNVSGEFLRVAFNKKEARGYLARAISGCVSGSWVTEAQIAPRSYLDNFTRMAWTMANRSGVRNAGAVLTHSLMDRLDVSEGEAHAICTNRVSIGGSPIMDSDPNPWTRYDIRGGNPKFGRVDAGSSCFATEDYLHNHVDMKLLEGAGVNPGALKALMLKASYKPRSDPEIKTMSFTKTRCPATVQLGIVTAVHFKRRENTTSTAISMLEGLMSGVDWRYLVAQIRGTDSSYLSVTGKSEWPVGSTMGVPYSDNMTLRERFVQPMLMRPLYKVFT